MILVVAEQRAGKLNRATWETLAAAQALGRVGPSGPTASLDPAITVVVLGSQVGAVASDVAAARVQKVVVIDHQALDAYTPDGYTVALEQAIARLSPSHVLLPHTYQTRDFAPALAARLDRALVTDVTGMKAAGGEIAFVRPMFQGKLTADVVAQGPAPHLIAFQIGAWRADQAARGDKPAPIEALAVEIDRSAIREKPEAPFQEAKQSVDLSQAERIVAVGRGIKGQEHLPVVQKLAAALDAELAASRPICDAGWLPMERQVGSSGQTVAPKLYVALGISGAIQHLVGMKGSQTIVAINKDADAPIFEVADYGIAGDLFEIVPAIVAELGK
ncbi:MAG TPA: electron transfer flavoprotein subunit alpha/FixB family protein [Vicinamibacterales bacterium]